MGRIWVSSGMIVAMLTDNVDSIDSNLGTETNTFAHTYTHTHTHIFM